jgi:hypothetical protein
MYMPTVARFTSRDPLPQDGEPVLLGTSYWYANNSPTMLVDPSGMFSIEPVKPVPKECVCNKDLVFKWDFILAKNAEEYCKSKNPKDPKSGYFIQKIKIWCDRVPCKGCPKCPKLPATLGKPDTTFYEAWEVEANSKVAKVRASGLLDYTDLFGFRGIMGLCGFNFIIGEVRFFCKKDIKKDPPPAVGKENDTWKIRKPFGTKCPGSSYDTPATDNDAYVNTFWSNFKGGVPQSHVLDCTYECCNPKPSCDCEPTP